MLFAGPGQTLDENALLVSGPGQTLDESAFGVACWWNLASPGKDAQLVSAAMVVLSLLLACQRLHCRKEKSGPTAGV